MRPKSFEWDVIQMNPQEIESTMKDQRTSHSASRMPKERPIRRQAGRSAIALIALLLMSPAGQADDIKDPERLAVELRPLPASSKVGPGDAVRLRDRVIRILEFLEKSHRSNRAPAKDLVNNSFNWHLSEEVSSRRCFATSTAILRCWETARRLGLFKDNGNFYSIIQQGPDEGEECVFEYIIPVELVPEFSTDPLNFRITTPSERRKGEGTELSESEQRYLAGLQSLREEVLHGVEDDLGYNAKEREDIWQRPAATRLTVLISRFWCIPRISLRRVV
jgi:hypothetical protein